MMQIQFTFKRGVSLLKNDLRFTRKYGIVLLYIILTVVYALFIQVIPETYRQRVGVFLIFTDPAAMGLFFMGAFFLLEKSQRVNHALFVSPISIDEYMISKIASLTILGGGSASIIAYFANISVVYAVLAVVLSSTLFSICAIGVSVKTTSLNQFVLGVVPFEIIICLPAILYLFDVIHSKWWLIHPGVSTIQLIMTCGEMLEQMEQTTYIIANIISVMSLLFWDVLAYVICRKMVETYMQQLGGGKI